MHIYQDKTKPIEERIEDLLSLMTLDEKIIQTDQYSSSDFCHGDREALVKNIAFDLVEKYLQGRSVGSVQSRYLNAKQSNELQRYAVEKTRLGIPFLFSEEALHGFKSGKATCFPQQIGLAATFEPELGKLMGRYIATEARSVGVHETFSPVMDLIRDPRYGRGEESYGEDVHLCSEFARETVIGMQGESLKDNNTVAAEPKHYVGYGNPVGGLNCAPAVMGRHDVFAECLPIFEEAFVNGKAVNAMCSYSSIDSVPVAMDKEILTDVLRGDFGMPGFVRSDMTAVSRLYDWHFITPTKEEAIKLGMEAGVDLQLFDFPHLTWQEGIKTLIENGQMEEAVLDEACRRILRVKFMVGLFENPYTDETLEEKVMGCEEHKKAALHIAKKSMCLLKNENEMLPLKKDIKKVAVIGPAADEVIVGDYSAMEGKIGAVSTLQGIKEIVSENTEVLYERGCNFLGEAIQPFHQDMLIGEDGGRGLTGYYYNGADREGEPVVIRNDFNINFNWIYSKPHPDLDATCFSVVWKGFVKMDSDMQGCIGLSSQDSMRLYIDGELLIDGFGEENETSQAIDFNFEAGKHYPVKIEFVNDNRGARVIFGYNHGRENFDKAIEIARKADVAIVCVGDNEETSGENFDRVSLDLPGRQLDFVKAIHATGTPVVLVMQTGRPVTANFEQENIPAILEAWFPGELGGIAIAQTLFGDNNPSGHLPITFPRHVGQIPCHYSRKPGGGQKYVEMNWLPLYPFGFGLSYTSFEYKNMKLNANEIKAGEDILVTVDVKNTGKCKGDAVPQIYLRDCFSSVVKSVKELAAFTKVELEAGETKTVTIPVKARTMRTLGSDFVWRIEAGDFDVMLGDNAENILLHDKFTVID